MKTAKLKRIKNSRKLSDGRRIPSPHNGMFGATILIDGKRVDYIRIFDPTVTAAEAQRHAAGVLKQYGHDDIESVTVTGK
jgi:hypothetical protein